MATARLTEAPLLNVDDLQQTIDALHIENAQLRNERDAAPLVTTVQAPGIGHPPVDFPVYHGNVTESFPMFLADYEEACERFGQGMERPEQKAKWIGQYLKGSAASIFRQSITLEMREDWRTLKEQLGLKFSPPSLAHFALQSIETCRVQKFKNISEYRAELEKLARLAIPTGDEATRLMLLRGWFVKGLDEDMAEKINSAPVSTFEDAFTLAHSIEAARVMRRARTHQIDPDALGAHQPIVYAGIAFNGRNQHQSRGRGYGQGNRRWRSRAPSRGNRGGQARGQLTCYNCGGFGHVQSVCPSNVSSRGQGSSQAWRVGSSQAWRPTRGTRGTRGRGSGCGHSMVNNVSVAHSDDSSDQAVISVVSETVPVVTEQANGEVVQLLLQRNIEELKLENQLLQQQNQRYKEREVSSYQPVVQLSSTLVTPEETTESHKEGADDKSLEESKQEQSNRQGSESRKVRQQSSSSLVLGCSFMGLLAIVCLLLPGAWCAPLSNNMTQRSEAFVCPYVGGTTVWALQNYPRCHTLYHTMTAMKDPKVTLVSVSALTGKPYNASLSATFCACVKTRIALMSDFWGKHRYMKQDRRFERISVKTCQEMVDNQRSPAGVLSKTPFGWSTTTSEKWPSSGIVWDCCRWREKEELSCVIHSGQIYSMPDTEVLHSAIAIFPVACRLSDNACELSDGRVAIWQSSESVSESVCSWPKRQRDGFLLHEGTDSGQLHQPSQPAYLTTVDGSTAALVQASTKPLAAVSCAGQKPVLNNHLESGPPKIQVTSEKSQDKCEDCPSPREFFLWFRTACERLTQQHSTLKAEFLYESTLFRAGTSILLHAHTSYMGTRANEYFGMRHCILLPLEKVQRTSATRDQMTRVKFMYENIWYEGYMARNNVIFPSDDNELEVEWRQSVRSYFLLAEKEGVDEQYHPVPARTYHDFFQLPERSDQLPSYFLMNFHKVAGGYTMATNTSVRSEIYETEHLFDLYPKSLWQWMTLVTIVYVALALIIFHCCPYRHLFKWLNPAYLVRKLISKLRKQRKRPRRNRRLSEMVMMTTRQSSSSERRERTQFQWRPKRQQTGREPIMIPDPSGSGRLLPYTGHVSASEELNNVPLTTALVPSLVEGKQFGSLLDSGSHLNLAQRSVVESLGLTIEDHGEMKAQSVSRHTLALKGLVTATIEVGPKTLVQQFYVVDKMEHDIILGVDAIKALGPILLDLQSEKLFFYDSPPECFSGHVTLGSKQEMDEPSTVNAVETLQLLPRTETYIRIPMPWWNTSSEQQMLFEPSQNAEERHEVLFARTLSNSKHGEISLRMLNPTDKPITIYKGTTLGTATPVEAPTVNQVQQSGIEKRELDPMPQQKVQIDRTLLTSEMENDLWKVLNRNSDCFARHYTDLGRIKGFEAELIVDPRVSPIRCRPYRVPFAKRDLLDQQLEKMAAAGIIQPSRSAWAAPIVPIAKDDNTLRVAIDYSRTINPYTRKDSFPLPLISDILDTLGNSKWFSALDLQHGYWQMPLKQEHQHLTAFTSHNQLYEFTVVPNGIVNGSSLYQRALQVILSGLSPEIANVYIDDILIHSSTFDQHLRDLERVLSRLRYHGLKLKASKCQMCMKHVEFLGHLITPEGLRPNPAKTQAVDEYERPQNRTEVRAFLGLAGFYRRFIEGFSKVAAPIFHLLKKESSFEWTEKCDAAFQLLKQKLVSAPILKYPDFRKEFHVFTDGSLNGIGAVLCQENEQGKCLPIAYASRTLTKAQRNYTVTELECLAVKFALEGFRTYIYGRHVIVHTDHQALVWLFKQKDLEGRLGRWKLKLADQPMTIVHTPGKANTVADALSRAPVAAAVTKHLQLHFDLAVIKAEQNKDKFLAPIIKFLTEDVAAASADTSLETQKFAEDYEVMDDVLYFKQPHNRRLLSDYSRIAMPATLVPAALEIFHDDKFAAHPGIPRTLDSLAIWFHWPSMRQDVIEHVRRCVICQRRKTAVAHRPPLQPIERIRPFEMWGLDVMELLLTPRGNRYLIVFQDYYSRWVEVFAAPDQQANRLAAFFVNEIVCRYGAPARLLTDRGPAMTAKMFEEISKLCDSKRVLTLPYCPQTDGMVERTNRSLQNTLATLLEDKQVEWDLHLPFALFALRTGFQKGIGESPFYGLFGQDARLPAEATFSFRKSPYVDESDLPYPDRVKLRLSMAREAIERHMAKQQTSTTKYYNKQRPSYNFKVGDLVFVQRKPRQQGRGAKLGFRWDGPFPIRKVISPQQVTLTKDPSKSPSLEHTRFLKPYHPPLGQDDDSDTQSDRSFEF